MVVPSCTEGNGTGTHVQPRAVIGLGGRFRGSLLAAHELVREAAEKGGSSPAWALDLNYLIRLVGASEATEASTPVGVSPQFAGVDLGAVVGALEVAHLRHELVATAVEMTHLGVEGVDDPPEQAFAFVGEMHAVGSDCHANASSSPHHLRLPQLLAGAPEDANGARRL